MYRRSCLWTMSNESFYSRRRNVSRMKTRRDIRKNLENIIFRMEEIYRESYAKAIKLHIFLELHTSTMHVDVVRYLIVRRLCFFIKLASSDQLLRYFWHRIITSVDEMSDGSIIYRISQNVNGSCQFTIVLVLPFVPPVPHLFTSKLRYEDRST